MLTDEPQEMQTDMVRFRKESVDGDTGRAPTHEVSFTTGECGPAMAGAKVVPIEATNEAYEKAIRSATDRHFNDIRGLQ